MRSEVPHISEKGIIFKALFVLFIMGAFAFGAFMIVLGLFGEGATSGRVFAVSFGLTFCGGACLMAYAWRRGAKQWRSAVAEQIGVPESATRDTSGRSTPNIPDAMRGQNPPRGAEIVASQPIGFSRVMLLIVAAVGLGLLYFGWSIEAVIPEWPRWVGYVLMVIGALLFVSGLWPNNWRKRLLGFIATPDGIYVHGQGANPEGHEVAVPDTSWLFVPWSNVVDVREGLVFQGAGEGGHGWWPSTKLTFRVTPEEARAWFPYAENESGDDGRTRLVSLDYSKSNPAPQETLPDLQQLWQRSRA